MVLTDIEVGTKILFKFQYKERPYSMTVDVIGKDYQHIIIPAILEADNLLPPENISSTEIITTVQDGVFQFKTLTIEAALYQGMRVYLISSDEEVTRFNRRNAYRVFIGELVKVKVITENGVQKEYEGILKNISLTGMCVILKNDLEVGSTFSILYTFDGIPVHLLGTVVRKEKFKRYRAFSYGCSFKDRNTAVNRIVLLKQIRRNRERRKQVGKQEEK